MYLRKLSYYIIKKAKETGKELWTYDYALAPVDAETSRYYFGLWAWKAGVKGCANWAYSDWQNTAGILDWGYIGEHLENMEIPYSFVYPSHDGTVPSIGWEAIREGVDDYRYLATLMKLIEKATGAGHEELAQGAKQIIEEIRNRVHIENFRAAEVAGTATGQRQGGVFDRPSPEAGISKDNYNNFRYRIAQEIMKLNK